MTTAFPSAPLFFLLWQCLLSPEAMNSDPSSIHLHMANPTSAARLSTQSGSGTSWIIGGSSFENLAHEHIHHRELTDAPPTARDVAYRMTEALDGAILPASESDTVGRVVVITGLAMDDKRLPSAGDLLTALGLKEEVDGCVLLNEARVTERDFTQPNLGFCDEGNADEEEYDDYAYPDKSKMVATTEIMGSELTNHFELNFSEAIVCAPVLYGGRVADGNLVAVLSMQVWT